MPFHIPGPGCNNNACYQQPCKPFINTSYIDSETVGDFVSYVNLHLIVKMPKLPFRCVCISPNILQMVLLAVKGHYEGALLNLLWLQFFMKNSNLLELVHSLA